MRFFTVCISEQVISRQVEANLEPLNLILRVPKVCVWPVIKYILLGADLNSMLVINIGNFRVIIR